MQTISAVVLKILSCAPAAEGILCYCPLLVCRQVDSVSFNVWDIGGPASMSTVNQCFFTDKALYVVIWNLAVGEEAVANLQSWLLNIEVCVCVWGGVTEANGGPRSS